MPERDHLQPKGLACIDIPALGSPVQALNEVIYILTLLSDHINWVFEECQLVCRISDYQMPGWSAELLGARTDPENTEKLVL